MQPKAMGHCMYNTKNVIDLTLSENYNSTAQHTSAPHKVINMARYCAKQHAGVHCTPSENTTFYNKFSFSYPYLYFQHCNKAFDNYIKYYLSSFLY